MDLQDQTFKRAKNSLERFIVLSENSDSDFIQVMKADNPIMIVVKKNARVLKRWRNLFASQTSLKGYPLVIVDDDVVSKYRYLVAKLSENQAHWYSSDELETIEDEKLKNEVIEWYKYNKAILQKENKQSLYAV